MAQRQRARGLTLAVRRPASIGFLLYSWLLHNWAFVVTNALILTTAILGERIYLHNRRRQRG